MQSNANHPIAPCGINCQLCQRFQREKNPCPGCRGDDSRKLPSCLNCKIYQCTHLQSGEFVYCIACDKYPCQPVKNLHKRYQKNYGVDLNGNLIQLKTLGLDAFVMGQKNAWACHHCGESLCMHKPRCQWCGKART